MMNYGDMTWTTGSGSGGQDGLGGTEAQVWGLYRRSSYIRDGCFNIREFREKNKFANLRISRKLLLY